MVDGKATATIVPVEDWQRDRLVLTMEEAGQVLCVSRWTIYQLIHERKLTTIKIGRRRLVPTQAINALIDKLLADENFGQLRSDSRLSSLRAS